ncbi:hypothetical protein OIU78_006950 [Salix suchowensis]|nr:hypothetical protein OIU78_006950 [Salix suchowensis]
MYPKSDRISVYTLAEFWVAGFNEVDEASTTIELGQEQSGIGLGIGGFDPLKAGSKDAAVTATFTEDPAAVAAQSHGY